LNNFLQLGGDEVAMFIKAIRKVFFQQRKLLAVGCWLLAVGCWLLAVGCWLLAVGCWLLMIAVFFISQGLFCYIFMIYIIFLGCQKRSSSTAYK